MLEKPNIGEPCNGCGLCCQITICSAGSYALSLVESWGERAAGPCPALTKTKNGLECGLVLRPKDWLPNHRRGVTPLRDAMMLCVGAGLGCDDAGDEPDEIAQPKLDIVRERFAQKYSREDIQRAAVVLMDRGKK